MFPINIKGQEIRLFHNDYIGSDLKQSMLTFFNKVKKEGQTPVFIKKAIISTIPNDPKMQSIT